VAGLDRRPRPIAGFSQRAWLTDLRLLLMCFRFRLVVAHFRAYPKPRPARCGRLTDTGPWCITEMDTNHRGVKLPLAPPRSTGRTASRLARSALIPGERMLTNARGPYKRCGCKDANRKNLNSRCPRLKERGHGAWFYRYSEPAGSNGKRRQPIVGPFPTKTAAETDRIGRLNQVNQGLHGFTDRRVKIGADLDRWLANKDVEDSTRQSYEELGRLYIKPELGHLRRDDLRTHHIEDLFAAIRRIGPDIRVTRTNGMLRRLLEARTASVRKPVSAARQRRVYAALHAYLESRAGQGLIPRNWAEHVELAAGRAPQALVWTDERVERWLRTGRRPSPVMVWTPEQAGLFLDFAAEDRLYPLVAPDCLPGAAPRRGVRTGSQRVQP
jgi:hypothetical protein